MDLFEPACIEPMQSCGFATQTSAMSGPPEILCGRKRQRREVAFLWPEASARGSRIARTVDHNGLNSETRHALHSLSLVQGRATQINFWNAWCLVGHALGMPSCMPDRHG